MCADSRLSLPYGAHQFADRALPRCQGLQDLEPGRIRQLYQGILQVGVGFLHLRRGNYAGATGVLTNGLARLEAFGPVCLGLDIAGLRADALGCQAELSRLGPEGLKGFDLGLLPEIRVVAGHPS